LRLLVRPIDVISAPKMMVLDDESDGESNAGRLSGRAPAWPIEDQRGTRWVVRVRNVALALMRCRS
jgi:hypothetical protein